MKKILITGSNGLLGQNLVSLIKDDPDFRLLAVSRGENRISRLGPFDFKSLDITDFDAVRKIIEEFKPDVLINPAAMTNVDTCEEDTEGCRRVNIDAVQNLIESSGKTGTHLIHLSTDFVFDGKNGPYKETDPANPLSTYGKSKREAEIFLEQSSIPWTIIRTILIYGFGERVSHSNIVLWGKSSLEKGQPIRVVNDQLRAPTLAEDLAQACLTIARKKATGLYHVSGPKTQSILDFIHQVARAFQLDSSLIQPISSEELNRIAPRPRRTGFVLDKAIRELDYQPHSFEEGLQIVKKQLAEANAQSS